LCCPRFSPTPQQEMRAILLVMLMAIVAANGQAIQPTACATPTGCGTPVALTGVPKNAVAPPPCTTPACATAAPKPLRIAKVEKAPNPFCDCVQNPACDCAKIETVEPELKEKLSDVFCACLQSAGDCPCRPRNFQLIKDSCGCLHLKACPCRMEYVEPETKEKHLEPELKDRQEQTPCGCLAMASCPCRVQHITPEIKEPPCPCGDKPTTACACAGLARN